MFRKVPDVPAPFGPDDIGSQHGAYQLIGGSLIQRSGLSVPPPGHDCAGCGKYASVAHRSNAGDGRQPIESMTTVGPMPVSYTHLRAHETPEHLVCRLLLE